MKPIVKVVKLLKSLSEEERAIAIALSAPERAVKAAKPVKRRRRSALGATPLTPAETASE